MQLLSEKHFELTVHCCLSVWHLLRYTEVARLSTLIRNVGRVKLLDRLLAGILLCQEDTAFLMTQLMLLCKSTYR